MDTITLFGTLAVLVYPLAGRLLGIQQTAFGVWAGTAANDTSQVVATGYAYGERAGDAATIVKLTLNLLIGPALIILGIWAAATMEVKSRSGWAAKLRLTRSGIPLFVVGFVGMAALNTLGVFDADAVDLFRTVGTFLISMAIAGIGLNTRIRRLLPAGFRPLLTGLVASFVLSTLSLSAVLLFWS